MAKTDFTRDQTINIAVKMGKILLKSGAETYRVEDTISRCCLAHGYEVDPFVTPTVIILGNEDTDSFIRVSRIGYRSTNLSLISEMNSMSYNFAKWDMGYEDTCKWLDKKWRQPAPYGKWMVCLAPALVRQPLRQCWAATAMTLLRPLLRAALPWLP
mgnify:FL=1